MTFAERILFAGAMESHWAHEATTPSRGCEMGGGAAPGSGGGIEEPGKAWAHSFYPKVVPGLDPKDLRSAVDGMKSEMGSGVAALVAVNEGRASVAVGVTDDLLGSVSAVELVKAAVAALGGQGGGGRPDMAQGGGPDGAKADEALSAVRDALRKIAA